MNCMKGCFSYGTRAEHDDNVCTQKSKLLQPPTGIEHKYNIFVYNYSTGKREQQHKSMAA